MIEARAWQLLTSLVVLITAFISVYVAYDLHGRGAIPEKHVELHRLDPINPLRDLGALRDRVSLALTIEGETINNVVIVKGLLRNLGRSPILPTDFHENLSVTVDKRWKIVAVENDPILRNVRLRWKRISDTRFEADPLLLNPGDMVGATIYLTDNEFSPHVQGNTRDDPEVRWSARIVNLRRFHESQRLRDYIERHGSRWIEVNLADWALLFTIVAALLFQAVYLHLLNRANLLTEWGLRSVILVVCASFLSFAAAESSATYLFGNLRTRMFGIDHWINAPWIILHWAVLIFLYRRAKTYEPPLSPTGNQEAAR